LHFQPLYAQSGILRYGWQAISKNAFKTGRLFGNALYLKLHQLITKKP
jgi:hypothetical protein